MRVRCTCGRARCARTVQLSWFAATLSCHQGLLDAFYALEVQWQNEGGKQDSWLDAVDGLQQPEALQAVVPGAPACSNVAGGSSNPAAAAASSSGSSSSLGAEVLQLQSQLGAVLRRQAEETRGTSGVGQAAGAEPGVAQGLLEAHAQLQQLQGRVCDTLAVMSSKDMPREAGLLAEDGTLDRAAGLGAMVQLQDTLEGAWECCG